VFRQNPGGSKNHQDTPQNALRLFDKALHETEDRVDDTPSKVQPSAVTIISRNSL